MEGDRCRIVRGQAPACPQADGSDHICIQILLEPIAYVTFNGTKYAFTATEAALYDQLGGLAAVGEIHGRAHGGAGLGIHHRHPDAIVAGGPEVGGGALVHVPAAAVKVALPGSESLCRTQADPNKMVGNMGN